MSSFDQFIDRAFERIMLEVTELPTEMGIFNAGMVACPQDAFSKLGAAADNTRLKLLRKIDGELAGFSRKALDPQQIVTAEVLTFFLNFANERSWLGLQGAEFRGHRYVFHPAMGVHSELPMFLNNTHPFRHPQDAEDYVSRVRQLAPQMTDALNICRSQLDEGISMPSFLAQETLAEIRQFYSKAPGENSICQTFIEKSTDCLTGKEQDRLVADIEKELGRQTYPAYQKVEAALQAQDVDPNRSAGLWQLPAGDDYYRFLLHSATTTPLSADEIHDIGLQQTALLSEEIAALFKQTGIATQDIGASYQALSSRARGPLADTEENRAAIVAELEDVIRSVKSHLPNWFHTLPTADVVVRPFPRFAEATATQSFQPPSEDGTRPGILEVNLAQLLADELPDLATLIYHESWPGHHLQFALAQELPHLPKLRKCLTFDAYIEGWAKYAETLPLDQGITDTPIQRLLTLRRELFSTVNLVVDTGIHHKRWNREQAIQHFSTHTGMPEDFSRYIVHRSSAVPAQLCSYKIGLTKMHQFRKKMADKRGHGFDLKDFHQLVLENGAVPLEVLERLVDAELSR